MEGRPFIDAGGLRMYYERAGTGPRLLWMAARIAGARLELFEGGHLFLAQDRRAYDSIVAFLLEAAA